MMLFENGAQKARSGLKMFGNKRKKATNVVIERMRPLIGLVQFQHGIPEGFWNDEFVLGFLQLMIAFHVEDSGYRLSQTDKGYLVADVFTALSNLNGQAIARRATNMAEEQPWRPDYKLGGDYAHICAHAVFGKVSEDGLEIVEEAKRIAAERGKPRDTSAVVEILFQQLYFQQISDRFEIEID